MYQVLLIPNITWQKDIDKDSYVNVISDIIRELNSVRNDLFWHCPLSSYSSLLSFPNVSQYIISMPSYPNAMRGHFNYEEWKNIINWRNKDFDLVYSHLPEWTLNVSNLLNNITNIKDIPIVGYTHWTEIKEVSTYSKTFIMNNINGLLEMRECGVNTIAQKNLILENVRHLYSNEVINQLERILQPHYLGIPNDASVDNICTDTEKIIAFPHRPQAYKDFPHFISIMDSLWNIRKDFKVWVPLLDSPNREYVDTTSYNTKDGYYKHLHKCRCCYCPKQVYAGWSVSGTDALMNGVPVIHYNSDYYDELFQNKQVSHTTDEEALELFNRILDDKEYRDSIAREALILSKEKLVWKERIKPIHKMICDALDSTRPASEKSKKKDDILNFVLENKMVSKSDILKHMNWGVSIGFTSYRKFLLSQKNIITTMKNGIEYYTIDGEDTTVTQTFEDFF